MFNWKEDVIAQNAIYLDDEVAGKGRQFKSRFLVPGLVKYDYGVCLLTKENADRFIQDFVGCPVIINHQDVTDRNAKEVSVGNIFSVWFDEKDGYYWCNGIITDKHAIELIDKGYSVSCQYTITEYSDNLTGALHNGNPYDKIIEDGKPEHLAIVNNPRYEGAIIAVNAIMAQNEDQWITIKPNGEDAKGKHLLIKEGETVHEAMQRTYGIDGAKGQQKLFDVSKDRKTKEDFRREKEEKQKQYDELEKLKQTEKTRKENEKQSNISKMKEDAKKLDYDEFFEKYKDKFEEYGYNKYFGGLDVWKEAHPDLDDFDIAAETYKDKKESSDIWGKEIEEDKREDKQEQTLDDKIKEHEDKIPKAYRRNTKTKALWLYKNHYISPTEFESAQKASNAFIAEFKDLLYQTLSEGIVNRLGELIASNEDKWITIHPHGKESDDYRRLKIKEGETVEEAMHRQGYYNKRKAKDEKKQKEEKRTFKERMDEKRTEYDYAYAKFQEVNKEVSQFEQRINDLVSDLTDFEEIRKFADKYKQEHKEELEKLQTKYNAASKTFEEKEKEFNKFKSDLADEMLKMDIEKLDEQELNKLQDDVKDFLYASGISHEQRIALQEKLFNVKNTVSRLAVKARANMVGGYTKKLNDLCGFTKFSDISSYSEDLQKHIYNNYKVVYDKYPQINYGGLEKAKLKDNVYAQNLSYSNIVTLNSKHYDDLNQLKSDYENDVKKKYHPEGTDYNSIIVHELGHGLQQYIEKKYKIKAPQIRETVLKNLGIKQKDVGNYLSMYAMAKPREAHEFFAEAFAEYMTSKNPRPLAVEFGKEIERILNNN